jgi:NADPH-dependent 2,4-dienoyl-CoA reductase/sulfur reductase-like enzyme
MKLIGGGRAGDPEIAEKALAKKTVDFIFIGKELLAEPGLVRLVQEGKRDLIRPCIGCGKCIDVQLQTGTCAMCSGNAVLGHGDNDYGLPCATVKKKVVVVGGGVGGVEAARIAAKRGHDVVLFEKTGRIGGQLYEAIVPPHKNNMIPLISYLEKQLKHTGVRVVLNKEVTTEDILAEKPDAVITATGVVPAIPPIPGVQNANVLMVDDVLTGKPTGEKVVIIGGGVVGCETAELLAGQKKKVTIVELLPELAGKMVNVARTVLLGHLKLLGVQSFTGTKCLQITDKAVKVLLPDGSEQLLDADTVIISVGYKPNNSLYEQLKGKAGSLYNVGDSKTPDSIAAAVADDPIGR